MGIYAQAGPLKPQVGSIIDLPYLADPLIEETPALRLFDPKLESLWLQALDQPSPALQQQAIEAFTQASRQGMTVSAHARQRIQQRVDDSQDIDLLVDTVRLLMALDESHARDAVWQVSQTLVHPQVTPTLDAALAQWNDRRAREVWRNRVNQASLSRVIRRSAIRSLGIVKDAQAGDELLTLVKDQTAPVDLRLAAAQSLGRIVHTGLTPLAQTLVQDGSVGPMLALDVIASHQNDAVLPLLQTLAEHPRPAIAAQAARQLARIAPQRMNPSLLHHTDPQVRLAATRAQATQPTAESIVSLTQQLNDPSVDVRTLARDTLIAWSHDSARRLSIISQLQQEGFSAGWRSCEQAALISGWIDDRSSADRLVQAMGDERPQVRLAACHALRQLHVPGTAQAITQRLNELLKAASSVATDQAEMAQLVLALGAMKVRTVEPTLRRLIPKTLQPSPQVRAAALWVLGQWHKGTPDPTLSGQWAGRLKDYASMEPEDESVRRLAAIALGLTHASDQSALLRERSQATDESRSVAQACLWALEQITGKAQPPLAVQTVKVHGWFLEPTQP